MIASNKTPQNNLPHNRKPNPTREEARQGLAGNICRCGSYDSYLNGVMRAAEIG